MTSDKVGASGGGRRNVVIESEKKERTSKYDPYWICSAGQGSTRAAIGRLGDRGMAVDHLLAINTGRVPYPVVERMREAPIAPDASQCSRTAQITPGTTCNINSHHSPTTAFTVTTRADKHKHPSQTSSDSALASRNIRQNSFLVGVVLLSQRKNVETKKLIQLDPALAVGFRHWQLGICENLAVSGDLFLIFCPTFKLSQPKPATDKSLKLKALLQTHLEAAAKIDAIFVCQGGSAPMQIGNLQTHATPAILTHHYTVELPPQIEDEDDGHHDDDGRSGMAEVIIPSDPPKLKLVLNAGVTDRSIDNDMRFNYMKVPRNKNRKEC
ncbi:uncharacterized protein PADG_04134 [Paracoccidioides brasiliensis Pb18]|uniref:Uncharacterized protein n=1 Tax=Paracoccidioides brasiliensis (strain Pb18) TaxID=502780 RepID=C1GA48_PARBD|nr:uncharacterized protein PADG_04134 [Paracoccidioides brasiliensis Pb18]EEH48050.2 hypothetical protein PADG_04134 [Paracoccidioides brasiliensis Pb18]